MSSPLLSLSSSVGVTLFLFLSYISSINLNISHLFFFQNLILYCCLCIQVLILYYFSFINLIISCELYLYSYSCLHVFMFACCMQQVTKGCNCIYLYYLMNLFGFGLTAVIICCRQPWFAVGYRRSLVVRRRSDGLCFKY
jgi:hypothetical protein